VVFTQNGGVDGRETGTARQEPINPVSIVVLSPAIKEKIRVYSLRFKKIDK